GAASSGLLASRSRRTAEGAPSIRSDRKARKIVKPTAEGAAEDGAEPPGTGGVDGTGALVGSEPPVGREGDEAEAPASSSAGPSAGAKSCGAAVVTGAPFQPDGSTENGEAAGVAAETGAGMAGATARAGT